MGCFDREPVMLNDDQKLILREMELIALKMDQTLITVCGRGLGYDCIIGLIPGVGDIATSFVSFWIVMRAWFAFDARLFRRKWCVMLMNVGIDLCVGCVPLVGDFFDVGWKANIKNVNIVRKFHGMPPLPMPGSEEALAEDAVAAAEAEEIKKKKKEARASKKAEKKSQKRSVVIVDEEQQDVVEEKKEDR